MRTTNRDRPPPVDSSSSRRSRSADMSVPERPQQESSIASRVPSSATVAARTRAQTRPRHPARVPFFANAAQPEIVRANQKDLYYLSQLTERVEDVGRSLLGTRWLQKWGKELQGGSKLAYFGLTTLLGSQTLGEEYCDIKQYHRKDRKTPSLLRRTALVLLHVLFPYLLARIYANLRRALIARHESIRVDAAETDHLFQSPSPSAPEPGNKDRMVSRLAGIAKDLPSFETLIEDYLRSVHLAVFYLCGRYYSLSKRAIGVRFISMQGRRAASAAMTTSPAPSSYEVLGVLMAVQLLVRGILAYRKRRASASLADPAAQAAAELERRRKMQFTVDGKPLAQVVFDPDDAEQAAPYPPEDEGEGNGDGERRCTLCLGTRRDAAATECGHVCEFLSLSASLSFCAFSTTPTPPTSRLLSLLGMCGRVGEREGGVPLVQARNLAVEAFAFAEHVKLVSRG